MTPAPRNIIYAAAPASDPDKPVYVGRSSRGLVRRVNEHIYDATHEANRSTFHDWIWLVGPDAVEWKALEEFPDDYPAELLAAREAKWIRDLRPELNTAIPRGFLLELDLR